MVISSLLVETIEGKTNHVATQLEVIDGVEVHAIKGLQVVVTVEADSVDKSHEIASSFIQIDGVVGINLVYANFEEETLVD